MKSNTLFMVGGCAGSFAAPSENRPVYDQNAPLKVRRVPFRRDLFGSRTTCFFLRHRDTFVLIDQGLGVEPVSEFLLAMLRTEGKTQATVHCLQTHFHDDHLEGLRANALFFQPGLTLEFHSPNLAAVSEECKDAFSHRPGSGTCPMNPTMQDILKSQFCASYWPVTLDILNQSGADRVHRQFLPGTSFRIDDVTVRTIPLWHPGGCTGFRLEVPGVGAIVIATDYEPPPDPEPQIAEFFEGAALLMADMQYRDAEYEGKLAIGGELGPKMSRAGWGHGIPQRVLPLLKKCPRLPERVRIVHHDPKRPDVDLQLFCEESLAQWADVSAGKPLDFQFAHEGDIFWL